MKGIDTAYNRCTVTENLLSCRRISYRRKENEKHFTLHVLYAPPVNRGNVCLLCGFPTLRNVKATVKADRKINEVPTDPDGETLNFTQSGDDVTLELKPLSLHKLVILK